MNCGRFLMGSYLPYLIFYLKRHKGIFVHLRDDSRI